MDLSHIERQELQESLLALKSDLERRLTDDDGSGTVELDQSKFGRLSRMDALQQQAMATATKVTYQKQLKEVLQALTRIQTDDYGYCVDCDAPIPVGRLCIRPEASLCTACQQSSYG